MKRGGDKMKTLFIILMILTAFVLAPVLVNAQTDQPAVAGPPLSQPLVREGTLATKLADVFKVGTPANEAAAESALTAVGIAPRNGWIGDYPVTPDIVGELQSSVSQAAESGRLTMGKEAALKTFRDVITGYSLSVKADNVGQVTGNTPAVPYPDTAVINNYYYDEGPPVVTYYAPPPDYWYLYSWVPYPFWWSDFWFPGFFVLADFDIVIHGHGYYHHDGHGRDEFISNHFRDPGTGSMSRIDPANRAHGGTITNRGGSRWSTLSAQRSAAAIYSHGRSFTMSRSSGTPAPSFGAPSRNYGRAGVSTLPGGRTYSDRGYYNGRTFSQPTYRMPYGGGRSFNVPSRGWRSYSALSGGSKVSLSGRGSLGGTKR